jgi:hypothetical protein
LGTVASPAIANPPTASIGRRRRALDSGNPTIALAAPAELEHVGLAEALYCRANPTSFIAVGGNDSDTARTKPQDPAASDVGLPAKAGFTQHEHRPEKRG